MQRELSSVQRGDGLGERILEKYLNAQTFPVLRMMHFNNSQAAIIMTSGLSQIASPHFECEVIRLTGQAAQPLCASGLNCELFRSSFFVF